MIGGREVRREVRREEGKEGGKVCCSGGGIDAGRGSRTTPQATRTN